MAALAETLAKRDAEVSQLSMYSLVAVSEMPAILVTKLVRHFECINTQQW